MWVCVVGGGHGGKGVGAGGTVGEGVEVLCTVGEGVEVGALARRMIKLDFVFLNLFFFIFLAIRCQKGKLCSEQTLKVGIIHSYCFVLLRSLFNCIRNLGFRFFCGMMMKIKVEEEDLPGSKSKPKSKFQSK